MTRPSPKTSTATAPFDPESREHPASDARELAPLEHRHLPLVGRRDEEAGRDTSLEAELAAFELSERRRLGLVPPTQWSDPMRAPKLAKREKANVTLLLGGLSLAHDELVRAGIASLGYKIEALPVADNAAYQRGKELGSRGQCNPAYFTVGNLVQYLTRLRDERGLSTEEIIANYAFFTAGACGPCRFGMYATEYRKAVRDAGFEGFRVIIFQQQGGLNQVGEEESGLEFTPAFFINLLKGLLAGDVLNGLAYRIRPYELVEGATDAALTESKRLCAEALTEGRSLTLALLRVRRLFAAVAVDRTQVKPRVSITGEFWAMTTEGDGNYGLHRFLEREGAECDVQFLTSWLLYNVWEVRFDTRTRRALRRADKSRIGLDGLGEWSLTRRMALLYAADRALRVAFQVFAHAAGFTGYTLPDMDEVARAAAPYYDNDLRGGEGHMEVAKTILNVAERHATMTLSVKPFGCLPSSGVSDGIQSLVASRFPTAIFCAVETSGDGAANFYSRVLMYLFRAKEAAAEEFRGALAEHGLTEETFRERVEARRLGGALHHAPPSATTSAAELVHEAGAAPPSLAARAKRAVSRGRRVFGSLRSEVRVALDALAGA